MISTIIAIFFGLLFITLLIVDRLYNRRFPPEKAAAEAKAVEERILRPDWGFYERHLQRAVPNALRDLYADRDLVTSGGFNYTKGVGISTFNPLDEDGLLDTSEQVGCEVVAIATSDCGDPIYLRPGPSEPNAVYITYHDGGETQVLAESIDVMFQKLRQILRKN